MSQPPPPYGGPPGPPYGGPPGPYPPPHGQPSGMSNKAKFWIGAVLALPVIVVAGLISGAVSAVADGITGSSSVTGFAAALVGLGELAAVIGAIVWERTRWFAIGVIAGGAVLLILAAGACIVLLVAFTNSYN
jgi:hypothetical protein